MKDKWVLDVGAFKGDDAEFYLHKGFTVVSVEANPDFARQALQRNKGAVQEGRHRILHAALADNIGEIDFQICEHGDRLQDVREAGSSAAKAPTFKVPAITPAALFDAYGVPYYAKIAIGGKDEIVFKEIAGRAKKPGYVSYALDLSRPAILLSLHDAGYSRFKLVARDDIPRMTLTRPPKEGKFVSHRFTPDQSGPFGRELPGDWLDFEQFLRALNEISTEQDSGNRWHIHAALPEIKADTYTRERFGSKPITQWEISMTQPSSGPAAASGATSVSQQSEPGRDSEKLDAVIKDIGKDWRRARYYDDAEKSMDKQWKVMIWPVIKDFSFDHVIDLACGHGRNTAKLAPVSKKVVAIDLNKENIEFCTERFADVANVHPLVSDGKSFPETSADSVSLVYCFDAMVHFDSDIVRAYLKEIARVLRKGGHAFLHHSAMESNPTGSFRDTPGWRNFMSPALFAHWAHKEGLTVIRQIPVDWRYDGKISDCITLLQK